MGGVIGVGIDVSNALVAKKKIAYSVSDDLRAGLLDLTLFMISVAFSESRLTLPSCWVQSHNANR